MCRFRNFFFSILRHLHFIIALLSNHKMASFRGLTMGILLLACSGFACDSKEFQPLIDQLTTDLKVETFRGQSQHILKRDADYFADLSLDSGEHDYAAQKKDEGFANDAESPLEAQQLRFLRQERERLADERDTERRQRLVLHMHHLQQNKYHVPRLLRKTASGKVISDEQAYIKRGGFWHKLRIGIQNWPSLLTMIFIITFDTISFIAAVCIPIIMIRKLRKPGLMAGSGVRTPTRIPLKQLPTIA
eukprot:GILJ01025320.1.p1 GENE.GILJ01025320.1~~GILJ01025320.1.p1  ORF type:complete len:247 (+),score=17.59 GILJ01025320.1:53-793(+)